MVWYRSIECQVYHYPAHKRVCCRALYDRRPVPSPPPLPAPAGAGRVAAADGRLLFPSPPSLLLRFRYHSYRGWAGLGGAGRCAAINGCGAGLGGAGWAGRGLPHLLHYRRDAAVIAGGGAGRGTTTPLLLSYCRAAAAIAGGGEGRGRAVLCWAGAGQCHLII